MFRKYPDAMSLSDLADCLGISEKLASRIIRSGEIYAVKVGREYRIAKTAVVEYLSGKPRQTPTKSYVVNVTSNPISWTCDDKCDIVCATKEVS